MAVIDTLAATMRFLGHMKELHLPRAVVDRLSEGSGEEFEFKLDNETTVAKILIPHYGQRLKDHYEPLLNCNLSSCSASAEIPFDFTHFGLLLKFHQPQELLAHNLAMELLGNIKTLVNEFGVLVIQNAFLGKDVRGIGHRNRFPHLNFHRDRNSTQPTPYSLYTRDPFCDEQKPPRISSTLFIANFVAWLQSKVEGKNEYIEQPGMLSHYDIFHHEIMHPLLNTVILEQQWNQPEGIGEIVVVDNKTALHSSYCRSKGLMGYRIGVRYLS